MEMEEEEEEEMMTWQSPEKGSMMTAVIGRAMAVLLSARPKKLHEAISRLDSIPVTSLPVSLEESLRVLHAYVRDAAQREEPMDEIIVTMTQHSLGHKDTKHENQAIILINWIFQDEFLFEALAKSLVGIIRRKEDNFISLGWCKLVRGLLEYETTLKQFAHNGIKERYCSLLKILLSGLTQLMSIVCSGSTVQGEFELPTRLSVAAADCVLAMTSALTKKDTASDNSDDRHKLSTLSGSPNTMIPATSREKKVKPIIKPVKVSDDMEMKLLLWDNLDQLIVLVGRLEAWSRKSRCLHAKGLHRVLKWLESTQLCYSHVQIKTVAGSLNLQSGAMLLSSCWKHYGILMHLEDYKTIQQCKELMNQYLSGIQYYAENHSAELTENKDSGIETMKFFINCLSLLLGHLDRKQFQKAISEYGSQISGLILSQLQHADEDLLDGLICILKAVTFRTNHLSTGTILNDTEEMDALLPSLLNLMDDRDDPAKAIVALLAEYYSISTNNQFLEEILQRLSRGNAIQRKNATDVISEIFRLSPNHIYGMQEIANQLLERLGDEKLEIRVQTSNLIPLMEPKLVVPALVDLLYSHDDLLPSSVGNAIVSVLKHYSQNFEVLGMFLNHLSNLNQNDDLTKTSGQPKLDLDKALRLISEWSECVTDWSVLVEPLIDKMFAEPSNATIVRFLSCVSEHLADNANLVFQRILLHTRQQIKCSSQNCEIIDGMKLENSLFNHLCPLLIIRLLPLRVFNDLNSTLMYGEGHSQDSEHVDSISTECVAGILIDRAFNPSEFEDVRKLAAELCGRIHPQVLFPFTASKLGKATHEPDITNIKACLFSICTSLVLRGKDSVLRPDLPQIIKAIETILTWPSLVGDEAKAQHGCIDCLALMICTEMQTPESFRDLTSKKTSLGNAKTRNSVLGYVIDRLTSEKSKDNKNDGTNSLSFRLCMANVLISASQKITDPGKDLFAKNILPRLFQSMQVITEPDIRAACVQVFFSAVYHLRSEMLPYAPDLLNVALQSLREASEKEKLAGAKLMVSLMASEEMFIQSIAGGFLEARAVLSEIASSDPSPEVRQVCKNLLQCFTSL